MISEFLKFIKKKIQLSKIHEASKIAQVVSIRIGNMQEVAELKSLLIQRDAGLPIIGHLNHED